MRVAIVSDIHGNRHAFEAVLDAIESSECREMWCLGDLVGYGAEPDECVQLARLGWCALALQRVSPDFQATLSPHRPVTWHAGRSRSTP